MSRLTLAFDMYGTVFNVKSVGEALRSLPAVGEKAGRFAQLWRDKQLEYSFRKGLMGEYEPFHCCTSQALDFCCEMLETPISKEEKMALLEGYKKLDAFPECKGALETLKQQGHKLFAFSNGTRSDVESLIAHAGLLGLFDGIVVVDEMPVPKTFKPDPKSYEYFNSCTDSTAATACLISSNPFDIIGSAACGWKTFWVQRSRESVFDPWPNAKGPSAVLKGLDELPKVLS
mmetsp:Transcript_9504/g.11512  ORF Transcript_9504/g.11512 Transcript_9504/m.11512 type:complete len:231 (+) Transcript_9504:76-768(+)|eukprot:Skav231241  [mRNA]  locus=scaffold411:44181:44873:- [translate_table: standard]